MLLFNGQPKEYMHCVWEPDTLTRFQAKLGDSAHNSTWEFLALVMACVLWAPAGAKQATLVKGDNIGALQDALHCKGKGAMSAVAREYSWRKVAYAWKLTFEHLPGEANVLADALSRLQQPSPLKFPAALAGCLRRAAPAQNAAFWQTWL